MINQLLDQITAESIYTFIASKEPEGRTIEYKQTLPGSSDEDKREFLADVSSFANALGGDILYGVTGERDESGKPTGLPGEPVGVPAVNADSERLRLDAVLRDGLDPRLPLVELKFIDGFRDGTVLLIRVGQSWSSPHMIKFKNSSRFYSRSGAGKQQLDVRDIRAAFAAAGALPQRMRSFRDERLSKILSGQSPLGSAYRHVLCLHLLPVTAFQHTPSLISGLDRFRSLEPMTLRDSIFDHMISRHNLDGFLIMDPARGINRERLSHAKSYAQVFRNGALESATGLVRSERFEGWFPEHLGRDLLWTFKHSLAQLRTHGIPLPLVGFFSMLGVKGMRLAIQSFAMPAEMSAATSEQHHPLDQDNVILPDVLIEDYSIDPFLIFKPVPDAIWQGCGYPQYFADV
ncbi:MAG: hypothetical protein JWN40_3757 [Phycisphaerales bacterium]|nr:hypothetical protein [Phycisphaerales bacterium]